MLVFRSHWTGICLAVYGIFIPYVCYIFNQVFGAQNNTDLTIPVIMAAKRDGPFRKSIGLYLCTWNVGECDPVDLTDALDLTRGTHPEIYAVGLQEVNQSQTGTDTGSWLSVVTKIMAPKGYIRVRERSMQGILLMVFAKRQILPFLTNMESETTKTGFNGLWGNKGGVSIRMDIYGMNIIIVNAHLAAHREKLQERIEDFDSIIDNQKFKDEDVETIMDHDYVFWMGDLNFRLNEFNRDEVITLTKDGNYSQLFKKDQLDMSMKEGLIFDEFHEGEITFPPTYKFDKNTDIYDTSEKNRVPAWTDRILWYHHDEHYGDIRLDVQQSKYSSHSVFKMSDHKPVSSLLHIQVFPRPPPHPVIFSKITDFYKNKDNHISYTVNSSSSTNYSDWIGLFKIDFTSFSDYKTYIWAFEGAENRGKEGVVLNFTKSYMTAPPGPYCLMYFTKNYSLQGISNTFKLLP